MLEKNPTQWKKVLEHKLNKVWSEKQKAFYFSMKSRVISIVKQYDSGQEMYAYTQTFKKSSLCNAPFEVQHQYRSTDIYDRISNTGLKLVCLPEPHEDGSIHYHGIILNKGRSGNYYNKFLPSIKKLGFVQIKKIKDLSEWIGYVTKDSGDHAYMGEDYYLRLYYNGEKTEKTFNHNLPSSDEDDEDIYVVKTISKKALTKRPIKNLIFKKNVILIK